MSYLPDELKEAFFIIAQILLMIFFAVAFFGLVISAGNHLMPSPKKMCLDSEKPRRFIPETYTCQEYTDGQWLKVDYKIEYNKAGKGK